MMCGRFRIPLVLLTFMQLRGSVLHGNPLTSKRQEQINASIYRPVLQEGCGRFEK